MSTEIGLPTVTELLSKSREEIVGYLGGVYEHSSWVASTFYDKHCKDDEQTIPRSIDSVRDLHRAMSDVVNDSSQDQKLSLLRAHPDLCAKMPTNLSEESRKEQTRAGLDSVTPDERARFTSLDESYTGKFGFPFILAVRNATKYTVMSAMEGRIDSTPEEEFTVALFQVHNIAWMRLLDAFRIPNRKGFLTCHVLDTAHGCPAGNMRIQLKRVSPPENAGFIAEYITNDDGRLPEGPALKGEQFIVGIYEWTFYVGDYFARTNAKTTGTPFLDKVPLRFGIDDPDEHYHVPLLVSPWSYSTYRGS